MPLRDKEAMRLYQQARRKRLRGFEVSAKIRMFVSPVEPKMDFEKIKSLRGSSVPIDDGYKIYFLFSGDEIVYIGQTRSLLTRISAHHNGTKETVKKDFDSIAVVPSTKETVNDDERIYIGYYAPKHNVCNKQKQYIATSECPDCKLLNLEIARLREEILSLRAEKSTPAGIIKTKDDAARVVGGLGFKRVAHDPRCGCMICKPLKVDKGA